MSRLAEKLRSKKFAITAEITPPLSSDPEDLLSKASVLKGYVDAVNVTDGASARAHMSSLAAGTLLLSAGIEPVLQFTCRDRNRIALQSDLLGAGALGIENLLILRGDNPSSGDQPEAKPVFDYESLDLIECAVLMQKSGTLPSGREIKNAPSFFIGCADTVLDDSDPRRNPSPLIAKIDSGVKFIQTQFCFDINLVRQYARGLLDSGIADRAQVLIGIGPLSSAKSARWMRENLWGTTIPESLIDRLDCSADQSREGADICGELMAQYSEIEGIAGVHLMAPGGISNVPLAIESSGLRPG